MSGWDKHPDYAGPTVSWRLYVIMAVIFAAFVTALWWASR